MIWKSATPRFDILDQLLQRQPAIDTQTTLALIGIGPDDFDAASGGVFPNLVGLILGRSTVDARLTCAHIRRHER